MTRRWRRLGSVVGALVLGVLALPAQAGVRYIHTDALGSVVAVTNEQGTVIERREYEPYGSQLTPSVQDGPGYTGHVQDAATGLVYMQQRYYDPGIGRFLSVDPVTATSIGGNFNRYWYANNNPYKFIDPDGRQPCTGSRISCPSKTTSVGGAIPGRGGTTRQQKMVRVVSDNHDSAENAAIQFGDDTQEEAKKTKREPNAGIVETKNDNFGYTAPIWGEPRADTVDVARYTEALIAVYGNDIAGLVHTHWDAMMKFSPPDAWGRGNWTYFMRNQNGVTYKLNNAIQRTALDRSDLRTLDKYLFIYDGIQGKCIGGCAD